MKCITIIKKILECKALNISEEYYKSNDHVFRRIKDEKGHSQWDYWQLKDGENGRHSFRGDEKQMMEYLNIFTEVIVYRRKEKIKKIV